MNITRYLGMIEDGCLLDTLNSATSAIVLQTDSVKLFVITIKSIV